jgi:hypothetical protein
MKGSKPVKRASQPTSISASEAVGADKTLAEYLATMPEPWQYCWRR